MNEPNGLRWLLTSIVDNAGVTRTKSVPGHGFTRATERGLGLSPVFAVFCVDDQIETSAAYGGPSGDMRLLPDLDQLAPIDAEAGLWWAPADQRDQDLQPLPQCQRQVLRRAVAAAAEAGLELKIGHELEFTVFRADGELAHTGPGYGALPLLQLEDFCLAAMGGLAAAGIGVEQLHAEYGPGQLEIALGPADPVTAVDRTVLARLILHRLALQQGLRVSFAPVAVGGSVGNGAHLHLSAYRYGNNLFSGGEVPYGLTAEGAQLLAGLVRGLPESCGIYAPSFLSYTRLKPGLWSGAFAGWGAENREAAIRLVGSASGRDSASANCEVKVIDGSSNPYLAAATVISQALTGPANELELPDPIVDNPLSPDVGDLPRLPGTLTEALDLLEGSPRLAEALGADLLDAHLSVRRYEAQAFADRPIDELVAALRWRY